MGFLQRNNGVTLECRVPSPSGELSYDCSATWPECPGKIGKASPTGLTQVRAAQRSPKNQVAWLHLRLCLVQSWCGTSKTIFNCWNLWSITINPGADAPAILPIGQWFSKFFRIPPWQTQTLSIPPQQRSQMIIAKNSHYLLWKKQDDHEPNRLIWDQSLQLKQHIPASYCDCYLTGAQSAWSWNWLVIAAPRLPLTTANGAVYDASRTISHRNPSWYLSLQHLHLWAANHRPQKVCICQRPSNHVYWWWLTNSGRSSQQRNGQT